MKKEEFRNMIISGGGEEHSQEVNEWLEKAEMEFERMAKATKWPIEKIRSCYNLFGIGLGLGQEKEDFNKAER